MFFWDAIKEPLFESLIEAKSKNSLSTSQRQALIKLLEKKDRDKRYIENWRPISLLNLDTKILTKALANKIKPVLSSIIKSDQTAYVNGRFIGESHRLISDILETTQKLNLDGFILTIDIQKAFDSVDHEFVLLALKYFGFGNNFINWIRIILTGQESSVMNGGFSTGYFDLKRGTRQGDPISAYLFILVMEIFFIMVRKNQAIKGINIFDFEYKLSAYADDATFFPKDESSISAILQTFDIFSKYSGLLLNKSKCEVCGIGVKRGVNVALSGLKCIDLTKECIRILGASYSYNEEC